MIEPAAPLIATFVGSTAVIGTVGKHVGIRPTRAGCAARLPLGLALGRPGGRAAGTPGTGHGAVGPRHDGTARA